MKYLIKTILLLVLAVAIQSCNDILDNANPSTSVSLEQQPLGSTSGIEAVRAKMYDQLHSFDYTTEYMLAPEALADNMATRAGAARFSGYTENTRGSDVGSYYTSYDLINYANLIIKNIPDGVLDQATLDQYRGEAYMLRAFAMHHLVRAFGYEPNNTPNTGGGSGWDLGIQIQTEAITAPSQVEYIPRKSVTSVYEQIESDLKESINLLSNGDAGTPIYVTRASAEALLARVYLYWRKYDLANQYATAALEHTSASLATSDQVASMFDETKGINPEAIFVITVDPSTESLGINNALNPYTADSWVAVVPTPDVMSLYSNDDARLAWFSPCFSESDGQAKLGCYATHPAIDNGQSALELDKWNAEPGQYADNVPFFRVSEMKLIQAEARLEGTSGDPLTPLNELRTARNEDPYVGTDVMQAILDERRREFIGEGQRFFDLKRLAMTINKDESIGSFAIDVPYSDYRVLASFPTSEVALYESNAPEDSLLIQNPNY